MAASKITYPKKFAGKSGRAEDWNEIKDVTDNHADLLDISIKIQRNTSATVIDATGFQWNGNTDSAGFTYTLPAGVQNRQYKIVNTGISGNQLTISPNGLEKLLGVNSSFILNDKESLVIGYDETDGWF